MKTHLNLALLFASCSLLSAAPVTWYLNNVTFTDGGRAFGSFVYDSAVPAAPFSEINVQTTPAASTASGSSAIGGGLYSSVLVASTGQPLSFISSGNGISIRRLQLLSTQAPLGAGNLSVAVAGTEGFCDLASCTNLIGTQTRSIAAGQLVRGSTTTPATWYLTATMDDGSQAVGSFDFDTASGTYSNVDVAITGGTLLTANSRLLFSRPLGNSPTTATFQTDQNVQGGTRVFVLASPVSLASTNAIALTPGLGGAGSYQGVCPAGTPPSCQIAVPVNVVSGMITTIRPMGFTKVVSQIADGGGWLTSMIITNTTDSAAPYAVVFSKDDGTPFDVGGIGSFAAGTVQPGGSAFLTSTNPPTLTQGSARVLGGQNFAISTIFTWKNANVGGDQQGTATGDPQGNVSFSVPFDNTGGAVGGFAITNTSPASVMVEVVAYDETGRIILVDSSITLAAYGHTAFNFQNRAGFSTLAGKRGLLRVFAIHPGATPPYPGLNGLLLKFLPNGSFTTIAVTNQ
ncbi:MAG: hypothetical protein ABI972_08910 [Acidobacteriota bacterium]